MVGFIVQNSANFIVGLIVFGIIGAVVIKMVRKRKNHKSTCCGCHGCPRVSTCEMRVPEKEDK